ncbi:MAG: hypothetical protein KKF33_00890 [Alphaproteobacteria bacterium]|jgi:hypothetical protein|nr:hypothetical protein [Alphaproteobacteria bacterium]
MNRTQSIQSITRPGIKGSILLGLASLLVLYTFMLGNSWVWGGARIEIAMIERGLCTPGDCAAAIAGHFAGYETETGKPAELYQYCLGTQELATASIDHGIGFVIPAIRTLLQFPCGNVYG